ncbi:ligand-binding protein SH3 [Intrasporangium oryzae NRRL B-24470]|uniref:Ligand-binding protein SH3 n=1 Tax=Intrasporangium oryzae NRRL B-24470 TaxID=1386089 RepID=W9GD42_9MICO|nr:multidrug efflux SMR transporter [Intrasporangium oryzae]EWT03137.1 ligand-binding protein SH3 [Intrasporangium oryzae NRRL B-24470]
MPWVLLVLSAFLEAVWASALAASDGLSRPLPAALFGVAIVLSMLGLARAARSIPMSTAYAVWTGLGAALTVAWAMAFGEEQASVAKALLIAGIVGSVVGLKLVGHPEPVRPRRADGGESPGAGGSS